MSKETQLRPLEEYVRKIKIRNQIFGKVLNGLDKTLEDVKNYDEMFNKLIDETYYIFNEFSSLLNNHEKEVDKSNSNNVERALIFSSSENIGNNNKKTRNLNNGLPEAYKNEILSPIVKSEDKSGFYTNLKNKESENKHFKSLIKATNPIRNSSEITLQAKDLVFLISNSKNIEREILNQNPVNKIDMIEESLKNKISKIENLEKDKMFLIESKQDINLKVNEINSLISQYDEKHFKLQENILQHLNTCSSLNSNRNNYNNNNNDNILNSDFHVINSRLNEETGTNNYYKYNQDNKDAKYRNSAVFYDNTTNEGTLSRQENNNTLNGRYVNNNNKDDTYNSKLFERSYIHEGKNNNNNYNYNNSTNNNYKASNKFKICDQDEVIDEDISNKINNLFSEHFLNEAAELWRKYEYKTFSNRSFERAYEMLIQILKFKERELNNLFLKAKDSDYLRNEIDMKNSEIVELFAELEHYKNEYLSLEHIKKDNSRNETKINSLLRENTSLYKENIKLKLLNDQRQYFSKSDYNF